MTLQEWLIVCGMAAVLVMSIVAVQVQMLVWAKRFLAGQDQQQGLMEAHERAHRQFRRADAEIRKMCVQLAQQALDSARREDETRAMLIDLRGAQREIPTIATIRYEVQQVVQIALLEDYTMRQRGTPRTTEAINIGQIQTGGGAAAAGGSVRDNRTDLPKPQERRSLP